MVVVGPGPVSPQRLTDPLAVGVAALALRAADAVVVQHGIEEHGACLSFLATLLWKELSTIGVRQGEMRF